MIHGPGCPVCVLPIGRLEQAIALARRPGVTLCTFGDMMRVPAQDRRSLLVAKAEGADIRVVYGSGDALRLARETPTREVVFFAIGFETTTPATAVVVEQAAELGLENFSVFCNHVLTPSAMDAILGSPEAKAGRIQVDGFVGPGHVSTIIGTEPYERFAREHGKPVVVSGFEPLDLMASILMLIRQLDEGRCEVENQYARAVVRGGNARARALVEEVFELRPSFEWRGLGTLASSALRLRERFAAWDAEVKWRVPYAPVADHKACACGEILRGLKRPTDCKIFGTACTPESPVGSCMVSPEGSCAAYYAYGRLSPRGTGRERDEEVGR
jgi:hydrogenase expression/formation protein HypD